MEQRINPSITFPELKNTRIEIRNNFSNKNRNCVLRNYQLKMRILEEGCKYKTGNFIQKETDFCGVAFQDIAWRQTKRRVTDWSEMIWTNDLRDNLNYEKCRKSERQENSKECSRWIETMVRNLRGHKDTTIFDYWLCIYNSALHSNNFI